MKIAKAGAVDAILAILPQKAKSTPILPTICITLKSLAVNVRVQTIGLAFSSTHS